MVDKISNNLFGKALQAKESAQNSPEKAGDKLNIFDPKSAADAKASKKPLPLFALGAGSDETPQNGKKIFDFLPDIDAVNADNIEQNGDSAGVEDKLFGLFNTNNIVRYGKVVVEKGADLCKAETTIALLCNGSKTGKIIRGLDKFVTLGNKVAQSMDNFQAWDKELGTKFVNYVEDAVNHGNPATLRPSCVVADPAIKLNGGLIQTFVRGQKMSYVDVIGQQAESVIDQYQLRDKAKTYVVKKAKDFKNSAFVQNSKATLEKISNSKTVETVKNAFKKNPAPAAAETVSGTSAASTAKTIFKTVGTKSYQGAGVVLKYASKTVPFVQCGIFAYDFSKAAVEGFEKDGIGGAVTSMTKQGIQTGLGIATSITAMKGGAAIGGAIGGPVGALIGGAVGAIGGFILGSGVGEMICDGLEWCGEQIIYGAEKTWEGIKWCGVQIACGAEKAWGGIKEGANWVADKAEVAWDGIKQGANWVADKASDAWQETKRVGGKVLNAINPLNWF